MKQATEKRRCSTIYNFIPYTIIQILSQPQYYGNLYNHIELCALKDWRKSEYMYLTLFLSYLINTEKYTNEDNCTIAGIR